jgi:hypothetical protein
VTALHNTLQQVFDKSADEVLILEIKSFLLIFV